MDIKPIDKNKHMKYIIYYKIASNFDFINITPEIIYD